MTIKIQVVILLSLVALIISCGNRSANSNSNGQSTANAGDLNNTNPYGIPSEPSNPIHEPAAEEPMMDECLIGEWVTVSIHDTSKDEPPDNGAGVIVTFDRDGRMTVDFSSMTPMIEYMGYEPNKKIAKTRTISGKAVSYIRTYPDKWVATKNDHWESTLTFREVNFKGEVQEWKAGDPLEVHSPGVGVWPYYTCTQDTLFSKAGRNVITYKRKS